MRQLFGDSTNRAWASQLECLHACVQGSLCCSMEPAVERESEWPIYQRTDVPIRLAQNSLNSNLSSKMF